MSEVSEGFVIKFKGESDSLEKASAQSVSAIGNIIKAASKLGGTDPFRSMSASAAKAVGSVNAITKDLNKVNISYNLPNFTPLQRLVSSVSNDLHKAFLSVVPAPDTNAYTSTVRGMVKGVQATLSTLETNRITLRAPQVQAFDTSALYKAVQDVKKNIESVRLARITMPRIEAAVVPAVDRTKYDGSVTSLQSSVQRINAALHTIEGKPIQTPAVLPPNLEPLKNVVRKAKENIESIRLIQMPMIQMPVVPPIDQRNIDKSALSIRGRIETINALFKTVSTTPINAPVLVPFNVKPLRASVDEIKGQLAAAKAITLPFIETPTINPLNISPYNKSVETLRDRTQFAASILTNISRLDIPAPIIPPPSLRPLFEIVNIAKKGIENMDIRLPKITVTPIQPIKAPAVDQSDFKASASDLTARVAQINTLFSSVSSKPIPAPALLPVNPKPLFDTVQEVKRQIESVRLARIVMPKIEPVKAPPIDTSAFTQSIPTLQTKVQLVNGLLAQVKAVPFSIPTPIPPDPAPVRQFVADIQASLKTLTRIPAANIPAPLVQPINLQPFNGSVEKLQASTVGIHNILHQISATPIIPPALRPPDLSSYKKVVSDVRAEIASAATIKMPRIEAAVLPPIDKTRFVGSVNDIQSSVAQINNIFNTVDNTPIKAPPIGVPNWGVLVSGAYKAKDTVNDVFTSPVPISGATNAVKEIQALFAGMKAQLDCIPLCLEEPNYAGVRSNFTNLHAFIEALLREPLRFATPVVPPIPPIPPLPLPPLDSTKYLAAVKGAIQDIQLTAGKGVRFEFISSNPNYLVDVRNLVNDLQNKSVRVPISLTPPDTKAVRSTIAEIRNDFSKAFISKIPDVGNPYASATQGVKDLARTSATLQTTTNRVATSFDNVKRTSAGVGTAIGGIKNGTNQAGMALNDFSRIVQDLPYGFIGIQNNINPLIESFTRLKVSTGGTGSAVRALLGGLMGGGGLGLALSAVTTAISFATMGFSAWTRGLGGAGAAAKGVKKDVAEVADSLEKVAAGFAASNVTKIEMFRKALTDVNIPLSERSAILGEYNKIVDKQNELSTKDLNNINSINTAINSQIKLFERRALVRAAEDKITELYKVVFENQFKYQKQINQLDTNAAANAVGNLTQEQRNSLPTLKNGAGAFNNLSAAQQKLIPKLNATGQAINQVTAGLEKLPKIDVDPANMANLAAPVFDATGKRGFLNNIASARAEIKSLMDFINGLVKDGGSQVLDLVPKVKVKNPKVDKSELNWDWWYELLRNPPLVEPPVRVAESYFERYLDTIRGVAAKANKDIPFNVSMSFDIEQARLKGEEITKATNEFAAIGARIGGSMGQVGADVFSRVFAEEMNVARIGGLAGSALESFKTEFAAVSAVGNQMFVGLSNAAGAFTSAIFEGQDGLKSFANSMIGTFKDIAVQLAKAAALALILSAVSNSTGSPLSFLSAFKGILGMKNGGIIPGNNANMNDGFGPVMLNAGEAVIPLDRLSEFVGKGGGEFPNYIPGMRIEGDVMVTYLQRIDKSYKRSF